MSARLPPLPEDIDTLLQVDREIREPPGAKDRILARLRERLPIDAPQEREAGHRPARTWPTRWVARAAAGGAMSLAKLAIAFAAGGAVTLGVNAVVEHARETRRLRENHGPSAPSPASPAGEARPQPAPIPIPSTPAIEAPPGTALPVEEQRPAPRNPRNAGQEKEGLQQRSASVEERTLLEDSRAALQRGDTTMALELLTDHERRFPDSVLSEEREALMVREALRAESYDQARAWLRRLKERYPDSPLLPVLEAALRDIDEAQ